MRASTSSPSSCCRTIGWKPTTGQPKKSPLTPGGRHGTLATIVMPRGAARQPARSSSPDRRKRAGRTRLRREIVAREWRPHLAAGEQQGHDDLDRRAAAETLAADGRARRLAAGAVQLDEE